MPKSSSGSEGQQGYTQKEVDEMRDEVVGLLRRVDTHEGVCAERYSHVEKTLVTMGETLRGIKDDVKGLYNRFWLAAIAIIGLLVTVSGFLLTKSVPFQ